MKPKEKPPASRMADAAEMLWVVLANVSGGDWTKQTPEWQEVAARWRDNYFAALKSEASLTSSSPAPEGGPEDPQEPTGNLALLLRAFDKHNVERHPMRLQDCAYVECVAAFSELRHKYKSPSPEPQAQKPLDMATRDVVADLVDALYEDGTSSAWRLCKVCQTEHRMDVPYSGASELHATGCVVLTAERWLERYQ